MTSSSFKLYTAITVVMIASTGCQVNISGLVKQDSKKVLSTCQQYLEALRKNDINKALDVTDKLSNNGHRLRAKNQNARFMYVDYWRQVLHLKDRITTVDTSMLAVNREIQWPLAKDIIESSYRGKSPLKKLDPSTGYIVEFKYQESQPAVIIPVIKINGKWLVADMPALNIRINKFKRHNQAYNSGDQGWMVNSPNYHPVDPNTGKPLR